MVLLGVGMGRFGGRSSADLLGIWTGEKSERERGDVSGWEVQGACLSLRGGGSACCWEGCGLIASADRGVAEGMEGLISWGWEIASSSSFVPGPLYPSFWYYMSRAACRLNPASGSKDDLFTYSRAREDGEVSLRLEIMPLMKCGEPAMAPCGPCL